MIAPTGIVNTFIVYNKTFMQDEQQFKEK